MTPAEHMAVWEKRNAERWAGLTCPVFYGKPEDIPPRLRHYPFIVATITVKDLQEFVNAGKEETQSQQDHTGQA